MPRLKPSIKERRLLRHLPTSNSIKEAALKSGYAKTTKSYYKENSEVLQSFFSVVKLLPGNIIAEYIKLYTDCKANQDNFTCKGILDSLSRCKAMFTDKQQISAEVTKKEDKEILNRYNRLSGLLNNTE